MNKPFCTLYLSILVALPALLTAPAQDAVRPANLTLDEAMASAMDANLDVLIRRTGIEQARQSGEAARRALFPQLGVRAQYSAIDRDRSEASLGGMPEQDSRIGAQVSQAIYDGDAATRRKVARRELHRSMHEEHRVRLDAVALTATRFLDLLLARSLRDIEQANLELTRHHLELARNRQRVGAAGPEEVLRWEAGEARQLAALEQAAARIDKARMALNEVLGADIDTEWRPQPVKLEPGAYRFLDGTRVSRLIAGSSTNPAFRDFSVLKALDAAPEMKALDETITAQRLQIANLRHGRYLPRIAATASYDYIVDQSFAGGGFTEPVTIGGNAFALKRADDQEWTVAITASIPVFEGGARPFEIAAAAARLDGMEQQRVQLSRQVEQRTLTACRGILASHPAMALSRTASDRATRSLDIVRQKYERGETPLVDMLEAQNQAFRGDIDAAVSTIDYLKDILEYQRSIGWFETLQTPEARDAWLNHLDRFLEESKELTPLPAAAK